jgi:hypothetical protein
VAEPPGPTSPSEPASAGGSATPQRQPGWPQVLLVAAAVVVVVLGAAALTSLLPTDVQQTIFHAPVLIAVLIGGTAWLLWRISRGRPA